MTKDLWSHDALQLGNVTEAAGTYTQSYPTARRKKNHLRDPGGCALDVPLRFMPLAASVEGTLLVADHSQRDDLVWADPLLWSGCSPG